MTIVVDRPNQTHFAAVVAPVERVRAANDDAPPLRVPLNVGPAGWDPYEIWVSRVRDPRAGRSPTTR